MINSHYLPIIFVMAILCLPVSRAAENNGKSHWFYHDQLPERSGKIMGIAMSDSSNGWIGTRPEGPPTGRLLYRLVDGAWQAVPDLPINARRADVLDVSPTGLPWVCTFNPESNRARDPRLNHFDGENWSSIPIEPGIWPTGISMISETEGWICGHFGELIHYRDGSWEKITIFPEESERYKYYLSDLEMMNAENGWAVGWSGLVLHYDGQNWNPVPVPEEMQAGRLWGVSLTEDGLPWVAGEQGLIAHYDGNQWQIFDSPTSRELHEIQMLSPNLGWAVGARVILRFNGREWQEVAIPVTNDQISFQDIAMVSPTEGWIVGNGVILEADDRTPLPFRPVLEPDRFPMLRRGAHSALAVDFDSDNDLDLITFSADTSRFFENGGASGFLEQSLLPNTVLDIGSLAVGDVNGDRLPDLFVSDRYRNEAWLYEKKRDGMLEMPVARADLNRNADVAASIFVDIDNNGELDLYTGKSPTAAASLEGLDWFANEGAGRFSEKIGSRKHRQTIALWGDLNGDNTSDMVLFGDTGTHILLNDGHGSFHARQQLDLVNVGYQMVLADLDVDGDLDLALCNQVLQIFSNDGTGVFESTHRFESLVHLPSSEEEITGICNVGDVDHDGYPDLLVQTVADGEAGLHLLLHRDDGYQSLALHTGKSRIPGHCAVFADWDGDGDLDLFVGGEDKSLFFENTQNDRSFLTVRLEGIRSNRMAIGARVLVYESGHAGDDRYLHGHQQLGLGQNPWGQSNYSNLHFGLNGDLEYDVRVTFPSGHRVSENNVTPGSNLYLREYDHTMRWLFLASRYGRTSFMRAHIPGEAGKLLLVCLIMFCFIHWIAPRAGARRLVARKSVMGGLLLAYLLMASAYTGKPPLYHLLQLTSFLVLMATLVLLDRWYCIWRETRYLGHYRLLRQLGQGGMGVVFQARNIITRKMVALKTLHPEIIEDESNKLRFFREAAILKQMDHPNIVKIHESGEADGRGYISMELLRGSNLKTIIRKSGPLEPETALGVMNGIVDALDYMHNHNILHRDLKTENIFVLEPKRASLTPVSNSPPTVKLLDFGLSRDHRMKTMTRVKELLGTLAYMAPEKFRGQIGDERSDIYALGVIFFEILTGKLPFEAENDLRLMEKIRNGETLPLQELLPELAEPFVAVISKAMAPRAENRYRSARAAGEAINQLHALITRDGEQAADETFDNQKNHPSNQPDRAPRPEPMSDNTRLTHMQQWRNDFARVQTLYHAGRFTDAQTLMLECMTVIEKVVAPMDESEWISFSAEPEVEKFYEWLERFASH